MECSAYKVHVRHPFVHHNKLRYLHAAVRFFCGTYTDHNGSLLRKDGQYYMYESLRSGNVRVKWDEWLSQECSIQVFTDKRLPKLPYRTYILQPMPDGPEAVEGYIARAEKFRGYKYDKENTLIHQAWYSITKWLTGRGRWIGKTQDWSADEDECSEYMERVFGEPQAYMARPTI